MADTFTSTQTTTYTDARAKHVMDKVFEDFTALVVRGFVSDDKIKKWKEDLLYLMREEVLIYFEIHLTKPNGEMPALRYYVKADSSLSQDSASGALGLYGLPSDTRANLYAHLNGEHPHYQRALDELHNNRGWGFGNTANGTMEKHHAYSKEGYGVERNKIGNW